MATKLTLQLDVTEKLWEFVDVLLAVNNAEDAMSSAVYDWWAENGNTLITVKSCLSGDDGSTRKSLAETTSDAAECMEDVSLETSDVKTRRP